MTAALALLLGTIVSAAPKPAEMSVGKILDLSCVEALAVTDETRLAGIFSFVAEKDTPWAFADLMAHEPKALKKYLSKLDKDFKAASGLTIWDHETVVALVSLYGSPLAETLDKPSPKIIESLANFAQAPSVTLEQLTAKRKN